MGVSFASFQDLGMLAFAMSSLKRVAMWGTSTLTLSQILSLCLGTCLQAYLMKVGVIESNPGEDEMLIPEIWVATKVRSSSSSGMVKGCGPRGCALLCLRPSWIKLSIADSVPVHRLTSLCCSVWAANYWRGLFEPQNRYAFQMFRCAPWFASAVHTSS